MSSFYNNFFYSNQSLVIIDPSFASFHHAIANTFLDTPVIVLESKFNEIEEIYIALEEYPYVDTLHLMCNSSPGCLYLGNICLNLFNLKNYVDRLRQWNILNLILYGSSNLAVGNVGKKFIQKLYQTTGANISAYSPISVDGVNWQHDYSLGSINPDVSILPSIKRMTNLII